MNTPETIARDVRDRLRNKYEMERRTLRDHAATVRTIIQERLKLKPKPDQQDTAKQLEQIEASLAAANRNLAAINLWIENHIFENDTSAIKKSCVDRHFLNEVHRDN